MGYTHYWTRPKTLPKGKFNAAVADCRKVVECLTRERGLALKYDSDQPEPPCLDGVAVWFNGEGDGCISERSAAAAPRNAARSPSRSRAIRRHASRCTEAPHRERRSGAAGR